MSQRALLLATRDHLRTQLTLQNYECDATFDGRPLPTSGERFIAVHPESWTNNYDEGIEEIYGIYVTVSMRVPKVPYDRIGPELLAKASTGLDALLESIRIKIHSNYTLMNLANDTYISGSVNKFIRPLFFRNGGAPRMEGGDWFISGKEKYAALVQTMTFRDAQRDQTIESMT